MVLEIIACRLIARYLGSSLYTWTSVIGVVLAGIALGNYIGGYIADRFRPHKILSFLFAISSASCVIAIALNNIIGNWAWLWNFSLPARVFIHVSLIFLAPSIFLGAINPTVVKMALSQGLSTGRTVGSIYAWGVTGSIIGTFLAGFYLIALMGTTAIIWSIAAMLLVIAILFNHKSLLIYLWLVIFSTLCIIALFPCDGFEMMKLNAVLKEKIPSDTIYQVESQYNHIAIQHLVDGSDKRGFVQDAVTQSVIKMNDVTDLQCYYEQIYAAVTHQLSQDKDALSVLAIGGGGYVFPRYVEELWPGSSIDVVEIDQAVTEAAMWAFGLNKNTKINTINMDARNFIDELLYRENKGQNIQPYDFIYGDAFKGYSVPFQLVTKEFNDKNAQILSDDGIYMINIIDVFESGKLLGAVINTLENTFSDIHVLSKMLPKRTCNSFVIIAAKQKINPECLDNLRTGKLMRLWVLSNSDIEEVKKKADGLVLTDDYAPVQNLLAPLARRGALY